jgi:hypothetical protein
VSRELLRAKLQDELAKRVVWMVYVEAGANSVFEDRVYSTDTIQGVGAKVIWITPGMRGSGNKRRDGPRRLTLLE